MLVKKSPRSVSNYLRFKIKNMRKKIAFIPTMGSLHEGHLSLIKKAKTKGYYTIVSIYINPSQFSQSEDFTKYPRSLKNDLLKLKKISTDLVFTPCQKDISAYSHRKYKYKTFKIERKLCGKSRPKHFFGVSEIVLKLLSILQPNIAYFGEKDYQQFFFIKTIIKQIPINTNILMVRTVREKSGLAMSSRNNYLTEKEMEIAKNIYKSLKNTRKLIKMGFDSKKVLFKEKHFLLKMGLTKIEYMTIKTNDLKRSVAPHNESRIFIAAKINNVRLIDNLLI